MRLFNPINSYFLGMKPPSAPVAHLAIPLTNYQQLSQIIETSFECMLRRVIFWEKDDKKIGLMIRFIHYSFIYFMVFFYILNHTFLPSYFLFMIYYCIFLLMFIHHMICGGCILTVIENRMIGDKQCFIDPLLEIFHIPTTPEVSSGVFILISCLCMGFLTLELILRTTLSIQQWFR